MMAAAGVPKPAGPTACQDGINVDYAKLTVEVVCAKVLLNVHTTVCDAVISGRQGMLL